MKNITVSVDEETYWLSRVKAAESGTSVSALVRSYLVELVHGRTPDTRFDCLHKLQDETLEAIRARGGGLGTVALVCMRVPRNQTGITNEVGSK